MQEMVYSSPLEWKKKTPNQLVGSEQFSFMPAHRKSSNRQVEVFSVGKAPKPLEKHGVGVGSCGVRLLIVQGSASRTAANVSFYLFQKVKRCAGNVPSIMQTPALPLLPGSLAVCIPGGEPDYFCPARSELWFSRAWLKLTWNISWCLNWVRLYITAPFSSAAHGRKHRKYIFSNVFGFCDEASWAVKHWFLFDLFS